MICQSCKKPVLENADFCHHCGAPVKTPETTTEYVYKTYTCRYPQNKGGSFSLEHATELAARAFFWSRVQETTTMILDASKNMGIVPVSEIGPASISCGIMVADYSVPPGRR